MLTDGRIFRQTDFSSPRGLFQTEEPGVYICVCCVVEIISDMSSSSSKGKAKVTDEGIATAPGKDEVQGGEAKNPARAYVVTCWKHIEDPEAGLTQAIEDYNGGTAKGKGQVKFAIWQHEQCATTGRDHLQLYLELDQSVRFSALKKGIRGLDNAAFFSRKGTPDQAVAYCSKDETRVAGPWRWGSYGGQGARTDLATVAAQIQAGRSLKSVASENPTTFIKFSRGITAFADLVGNKRRTWQTEFVLYYGDAGSGKTTDAEEAGRAFARSQLGDEAADFDVEDYCFTYSRGNNEWWDGYDQQGVVFFHDVYGGIKFHSLLALGDRTNHRVEVKGAWKPFLGRRVYFTANSHWEEWYNFDANPSFNKGALDRRFTEVWEYRGKYDPADPNSVTKTRHR